VAIQDFPVLLQRKVLRFQNCPHVCRQRFRNLGTAGERAFDTSGTKKCHTRSRKARRKSGSPQSRETGFSTFAVAVIVDVSEAQGTDSKVQIIRNDVCFFRKTRLY
jgi:hypothetical protein